MSTWKEKSGAETQWIEAFKRAGRTLNININFELRFNKIFRSIHTGKNKKFHYPNGMPDVWYCQ